MSKRDKFQMLMNNTANPSQEKSIVDSYLEEAEEIAAKEEVVSEVSNEKPTKNENNGLAMLSPDLLIPYSDEKLRLELHTGDEREQLKESIKKNGIINPVIVMPAADDKYEILSGHNRVDVCKELGIEVPVIIKSNLSKEEADLICIDTNLLNRQRSEYKPTTLAYVLKVKFDAEKHQGSMSPEVTKLTGEKIGEEYGLSRKTIHMYIKLNDLVETAKKCVDDNEISIKLAYELSFLEEDVQMLIINLLGEYTINDKIVHVLRMSLEDKEFANNQDKISYIKGQLESKETKKRAFDYRNVKKYIPKEIKEEEIEEYIIQAIKSFRKF